MKPLPKLTPDMVRDDYSKKWLSVVSEHDLLYRNHWDEWTNGKTGGNRRARGIGLKNYLTFLAENGWLTDFYTDFLNTPDEKSTILDLGN